MGVSQNEGCLFGGPYSKNYNILGSILGTPYLGKRSNDVSGSRVKPLDHSNGKSVDGVTNFYFLFRSYSHTKDKQSHECSQGAHLITPSMQNLNSSTRNVLQGD